MPHDSETTRQTTGTDRLPDRVVETAPDSYELRLPGADWPFATFEAYVTHGGRKPLNDPKTDAEATLRAITSHQPLVEALLGYMRFDGDHTDSVRQNALEALRLAGVPADVLEEQPG